ncbi:MAG: YIP1 family protein [Cyanobacteria bacterium]|nr:YIP1 family protein [Cyanobacteriota bacterium]
MSADFEDLNFLDIIYGGLFQPISLFRRMAQFESIPNRWVILGLILIVLVSAVEPLLAFNLRGEGHNLAFLLLEIPFYANLGVFIWLFMAGVMGLLSRVYRGKSEFKLFLVLSALSTLPWFLMAPIVLLKFALGVVGMVLAAVSGLIVWLWTVLLFALAIGTTYKLAADRVLVLLTLPFAFSLIAITWIGGFFVNMSQWLHFD